MKRGKTGHVWPLWAILLLGAFPCSAVPMNGGALDGGGGMATSANYQMTGGLGGIGGAAGNGAISHTASGPFMSPEVTALSLTAAPAAINQGQSSQLGGIATMDDQTTTVVSGADIAWQAVGYPLQSLDNTGVLLAVPNVSGIATGNVQGCFGVVASTTVQILGLATNGVPVWWLRQYFPTATDFDALALADSDHNGLANWQKYLAGLDPTNPNSNLLLALPLQPIAGSLFTITWPGVPGKTYQVEYCTTPAGPWLDNLPASQLTANAVQTVLTYSDYTQDVVTSRFYRVKLVVQQGQ